jgi:hypothetical protein
LERLGVHILFVSGRKDAQAKSIHSTETRIVAKWLYEKGVKVDEVEVM